MIKRQLADSIDSEISSYRMEDFLKSTGMDTNEQVKQASEILIILKIQPYKQNSLVISKLKPMIF